MVQGSTLTEWCYDWGRVLFNSLLLGAEIYIYFPKWYTGWISVTFVNAFEYAYANYAKWPWEAVRLWSVI